MRKATDEKGFTLIEMLVVLFIIGLILAIAIPNLKAAGEKASSQADRANRRLIASQADNYFLEYGTYPASVEELVKTNYLRSVPKCPGGGTYVINRKPDVPAEERVTCKR
ncbi:competence type IV pilus major pilin ComGC [Staphylospora marina]|uniref:competence type IV pilus major pilin ComGC n=1 Tax=Staphylospora marina TaxID=2490858 RepID=UPI000F5BBF49|nr:prepilin-type N-terminal cleavage/methylation domain-containing protein [Staphylospora marina]